MIRNAIIVVLTVVSSVAVTLAVGSYSLGSYLARKPTRHSYVNFEASRGWLCIEILKSSDASLLVDRCESKHGSCEPDSLRGFSGFWYSDPIWGRGGIGIPGTSQTRKCLDLFHWSIYFATYPTIAFIRGPCRRYRRRKRGLCLKCGYDLTGNESGTCSEFGEAVQQGL